MTRSRWFLALVAITAVPAATAQEAGSVLTARTGEALIPPRDYGHSDGPVDPARHDPIESGKIYDIAYAGIARGKMQFERRGYSIADLTAPAYSQTEARERNVRTILIRDIELTILEAKPDRLRYIWAYRKGASDAVIEGPADSDPGEAVPVDGR